MIFALNLLNQSVAVALLATQGLMVGAPVVEVADVVRRYDPRSDKFVEVAADAIKPGKIYNHYSKSQGRFVWAYATDGGGFSYALGPGSTESPTSFDLVTSARETARLVERVAGNWASASQKTGSRIMVRLGEDGKWSVLRSASIRSHYDLDTLRRWEWHGERRVAVSHTGGYLWLFDGAWYTPAGPWLLSSSSCGCL